jgi:hypothetical protein
MRGIGMAELTIIVWTVIGGLVPLLAGIWALITLRRLKVGQQEMQTKLESIERLLSR